MLSAEWNWICAASSFWAGTICPSSATAHWIIVFKP